MKEFSLPIKYNWELAHKPISDSGSSFTYEIGQYVQSEGGVILHRYSKNNIQTYIVLDTTDCSNGVVWSNITNINLDIQLNRTRWDGEHNTNMIVTQSGFTNGAAKICLDLDRNGINDWYLPSVEEFRRIFTNGFEVCKGLGEANAAPFSSSPYWTSSITTSPSFVWAFAVGNDYPFGAAKSQSYRVRAVRQFSI